MDPKETNNAIRFAMPENWSSVEPLQLNEKETSDALKNIQEIYTALTYLRDSLKQGITIGDRYNGIAYVENRLEELRKTLKAEDDKTQNAELSENQLRAANQEIFRLQQQMGTGINNEAVGHKLYQLHEIVYKWWKNLGFTFSKTNFGEHGCGGYCSAILSGNIERYTENLSEKEKIEKVKNLEKQLDLWVEGDSRYFLNNEKNKNWLTNTIKTKFPSAEIFQIRTLKVPGKDLLWIREVDVTIPIEAIV